MSCKGKAEPCVSPPPPAPGRKSHGASTKGGWPWDPPVGAIPSASPTALHWTGTPSPSRTHQCVRKRRRRSGEGRPARWCGERAVGSCRCCSGSPGGRAEPGWVGCRAQGWGPRHIWGPGKRGGAGVPGMGCAGARGYQMQLGRPGDAPRHSSVLPAGLAAPGPRAQGLIRIRAATSPATLPSQTHTRQRLPQSRTRRRHAARPARPRGHHLAGDTPALVLSPRAPRREALLSPVSPRPEPDSSKGGSAASPKEPPALRCGQELAGPGPPRPVRRQLRINPGGKHRQ